MKVFGLIFLSLLFSLPAFAQITTCSNPSNNVCLRWFTGADGIPEATRINRYVDGQLNEDFVDCVVCANRTQAYDNRRLRERLEMALGL